MPCSCRRATSSAVQRCAAVRPQQKLAPRVAAAAAAGTHLPASHAQDKSQEVLAQLAGGKGINRYAAETKPCIISIGLTIHSTPVEIREKLAIAEAEWPRAIEELTAFPHIEEASVLSTCNRFELYAVGLSWHRGVREIEEWMSNISGIPLEELRPYMFLKRDRDATWHLLRVASGLDSLVMGEGQILAQVKQVYKVGQECHGFGRHLNGLFKQAITAGKRVRAETNISTGSVSVSSAAVELALLKLPTHDFDDARVTIIGAGKMATLLVKHLSSKGCKAITMLNRSLPRAQQLAADYPDMQFDIKLMPELMDSCNKSDVIFAASNSEAILVDEEHCRSFDAAPEVVGQRRFVDISVPRNFANSISEVEGNIVYNVDDLKEVVAANKQARKAAAQEAEVLLEDEQLAFEAWRDSLETVPTIKALRQKAEDVRMGEMDKATKKLGDGLTKKQVRAVEDLTKGIVNKLLHGPMTALRCDGSDPDAVNETLTNMEALERMFSLSTESRIPTGGKR